MVATPLFSIIVPTFNVAGTIRACLDSITSQTWTDYELVVIDGGSTDGSLDLAKSYEPSLDGRLVLHSGPDDGVYDAMNNGVRMANGTWVFFIGADDTLYEPETLARVAGFIGDHTSSDLVYGDVIMRSTSSRYAGVFDVDRLLFEQNICHQAIFYRRKLFETIGPYNLRYRMWADWDFNIRCFSNPALVTRYMDIVVANYNDLSGLSTNVDEEFKKRSPRFVGALMLELFRRKLPTRGK
ncbi:glycosyltransferase family 2 protein [Mycobacterium riyadhense]|uniref:Glycosyltransferase n=1 Tax=Mycobacterium riyadhense TaxID=486698 RepID=A0A1X2BVZ5_9MYCO|nr:glycosyltransferase family 2 protein [Mycobacterium riyadhense]MCV7145079.1 glycosyltransferase [Mycobacterium riyadhense]ORW67793.1 glycosyltransferase [Mycobacterium riyadhense]VTO97249.1 PGL/p-HBAD biosynthesis glycosyltransferase/MT3031 [Mycobacterium riyadhense]